MKQTLLELTQEILSEMDSDEVNSISDTTESLQVARIIRATYFNILARANLPEHKQLFQLDSSADDAQPTLMTKPENVSRIEWLKYNKLEIDDTDDRYGYVTILPIPQFFDMIHMFSVDDAEVGTFTLNDHELFYRNDRNPEFCTIIDDNYVIFDSYNSEVDTTLQSSKTLCYGQVIPTFTFEDSFTPELDEQQFPLLLNEAMSKAHLSLKQAPHDISVMESRRQWRTLQRTKHLAKPNYFNELPNFGRNVR